MLEPENDMILGKSTFWPNIVRGARMPSHLDKPTGLANISEVLPANRIDRMHFQFPSHQGGAGDCDEQRHDQGVSVVS
jgi:hypothetical protein